MKRSAIFLTLLLVSCFPNSTQPRPTRAIDGYVPSLSSFQINEECPNVCWLGMHAGQTSTVEAVHLITDSGDFDQQFTQVLDDRIEAYWFLEKTHTFGSNVSVITKGDLVESIYIGPLEPFKVMDAIDLWGEPDQINIRFEEGQHGEVFTVYSLYYIQFNTMLLISPGSLTGPDPKDFIHLIEINAGFGDVQRQPWLGYGRLKDYLLDSEVP